MIRIEVTPQIITKKGVARATGKPYEINEQVAYAHLIGQDGQPNKYPTQIALSTRDGILPAGDYTLNPSSLTLGQWGTLDFTPRLVPLRPQAARQAA